MTSTVPWNKTAAWSAAATFVVLPPPFTVVPAAGFIIPGFTQLSNPVTVTITTPSACPYSAAYASGPFGLAQITTVPAAPQASNPTDAITITLSRESDAAYTGTLTVTLTSAAGGPPVVVPIPITAL
ncbi:MAG: hypothetical protein JKY86_00375 [Gammaproteobacteria bacterium]|nr:hypothetical protein [Gammaproteobacteria bacterium]